RDPAVSILSTAYRNLEQFSATFTNQLGVDRIIYTVLAYQLFWHAERKFRWKRANIKQLIQSLTETFVHDFMYAGLITIRQDPHPLLHAYLGSASYTASNAFGNVIANKCSSFNEMALQPVSRDR